MRQTKVIKLELGGVYSVSWGLRNFTDCKLIQVTRCGYNFLILETDTCLLYPHLYPSKYENHRGGLYFFVNKKLNIYKKKNLKNGTN